MIAAVWFSPGLGHTAGSRIHGREAVDGNTEERMVEAGTPNTLLRRAFTKASLQPGTLVKVDSYQSKDGSSRANGAKAAPAKK